MSSEDLPRMPLLRLASSDFRKDQRSEKRVAPSGCEIVDRPVDAGTTWNGAYDAARYPDDGMPVELSATKPGRTSVAARLICDSSATTAPMCGAMEPVAPPGLRAICAHDCPSVCTADHESPERTNVILSSCAAVLGINPCAKRSVLLSYDVGAKSAGVQAPSFRSHISMLLGAPGRKMKMQFFAVFLRSTPDSVTAPWSRRGLKTSAK